SGLLRRDRRVRLQRYQRGRNHDEELTESPTHISKPSTGEQKPLSLTTEIGAKTGVEWKQTQRG
ncbi:MAG: hypothetical protein J5925_06375, partial [Clostridia bacterium]|nr:hypothetical protein [Clostridia bacterium]